MQQPMQPAKETIKRIFDILIVAPSCPAEIQDKTGLSRITVNDLLNFIVREGLVSKKRSGQRILYSLVVADDDWQVLWAKLMHSKKEQPLTPRKAKKQISKRFLRKELTREISNLRERFGTLVEAPSNDELIDTLLKLHKDVAPQTVLIKTRKPFCLECLSSTKLFFPMLLIEDSNEFCCPNCGITIPRITTETDQPLEKIEEAKRREQFYDAEKKKKSYTEIERLLTKYKEGTKKKRKAPMKARTVK